ncbi:hypothetical protein OG618_35825 [Kitasatospora sp. NBC_01246]|uniref:terpene synthase family protein n=1 Tax=Kitasatospora sp. NBC_01246 TaxID=2903570 RepID=UPI002E31BB7F|nr:hypothetical protein [Kitasatospora sp. NBC_01246]
MQRPLSDAVRNSGTVRSLERTAADHAGLVNDLFSFQREVEFEGDFHNAPLVVRHFFDCGYPGAARVVADLATARLDEFEHLDTAELPFLCDDLDLDGTKRQTVADHVERFRTVMTGNLHWHAVSGRYREADLRQHDGRTLSSPAGLGTAAARLPRRPHRTAPAPAACSDACGPGPRGGSSRSGATASRGHADDHRESGRGRKPSGSSTTGRGTRPTPTAPDDPAALAVVGEAVVRTLTGDLTVDNTDRLQHAHDQVVGEAEGLVAVDLADFTLSGVSAVGRTGPGRWLPGAGRG